jgi:3-hydroxy-9,10-secoandrosta-1,3,5(10)-triene-9,17-dione monooxygenase
MYHPLSKATFDALGTGMLESAELRTPEVPAPEPDLSPQEIIARAQALIPEIRDQQAEAERLGHHIDALDRKFTEAGFYRILQPRRFGGYEFDLPTFWKVTLAVATGDPGTGWGLTLGAHHALVLGAFFPEEGQREIFGPAGDYHGPHRAPPTGTAQPVDGGFMVSGTWDYCSGIAHATHLMANTMIAGTQGQDRSDSLVVVVPMEQVTVLDDWGDGVTLGMNSSGSNSARVEHAFVPAHRTSRWNWTRLAEPAPGARLHGNMMYCGRIYSVYHGGLVIPVIGAARAALAEFEQIITTRKTYLPPPVDRYTHPDYQRPYGHALALTDSAEALLLHVAELYMRYCQRWSQTGQPFSREDDVRLYAMLQQAAQLAIKAIDVIFAAASSSAAKRGQRIQRYYRDVCMYHGHIAAQYLNTAGELARVHFGLPDTLF